jgi:predicted nucleotidyltransferase
MYTRLYKEYKDAKETAAESLGLQVMPSNFEVAEELDLLASEMEPYRQEKLLEMRYIAIEVMKLLKKYEPKLIGSVWRGTIRKGSDIDIILFSSKKLEISQILHEKFDVRSIEDTNYIVDGIPKSSTHIKIFQRNYEVEVVVRSPEDETEERCEVYGDVKRGIGLSELEKLMRSDPLRRFIPKRRFR